MNAMPKGVEIAMLLSGLGLLATLPCLIVTTPITMTVFFLFGIPLFALGFFVYVYAVLSDLRHHGVL
jgi:hypothetical protein